MMGGYSVTEAASVLGVPTERVWELLARGVLVGEPEGETGMRVFMQPRPAPAPVAPADDPVAARSNGPEREMSPFRELLTEFRSLTERYGQALLALGESRGEVASLRSRVDLLEARIDLRLPMGPPSVAPWPTQSLPVSERADAAGAGSEAAVEHDDEDAHPRRRRGARRATESFAEALARAEDPSLADLSRGSDADALAAFRSEAESAAESVEADRILPREVLPAEPMLVAEEPEAIVGDAEPELVHAERELAPPAAIEREAAVAEGDADDALIATLPAAEAEPWPEFASRAAAPDEERPDHAALEPEPEALQPDELGGETLEPMEPEPEAPVEPEPGAFAPIEPEPGPLERAEPQAPPEPRAEPETQAASAAEPRAGTEAPPEPADFDAERYTTAIEQPDWFEAEVDDAWLAETASGGETTPDLEVAEAGASAALPAEASKQPELPAADELPAVAELPADEVAPEKAAERSVDDEPGWSEPEPDERGADEMESAGTGGQGPSVHGEPEPETGLPGSLELDEALEAFGPVAGRASGDAPRSTDEEWPSASVGDAEPPRWPSPQGRSGSAGHGAGPPYSPSLGGGSATRAYRRLRRIFPT